MVTDNIITLIEETITTFDGRPSHDHEGPHVIVEGPWSIPAGRALPGQARTHSLQWRLTCVNNNPAGSRAIANKLVTLLDGTLMDGEPLRVTYQTSPLEDRDDPSQWRWTSNVEVQRSEGA